MDVDGQLLRSEGGWQVRFERRLAHPAARVWQAIVDPDERLAWFPDRAEGDFTQLGATLTFYSEFVEGGSFTGVVLDVEPGHFVQFSWGPDVIRIAVRPDGDGCVLTLLDTLSEIGKAARDGAGWQVCLDKLVAALKGARPSWTDAERWQALHPDYVAGFGPSAARVGPPATAD